MFIPDCASQLDKVAHVATLLAATVALLASRGTALEVDATTMQEQGAAAARERLGAAAFAQAWQQGHALSMEQAIELAQSIP